ncbi:hypothetical protein Cgig2_005465 [Carnegiea gigantea]|uniref:Nudix hydrolase domain-containing protein n=1 Tax=Carnegiea gigantea TaxID=171969 RepID=A0A9Q1KC27_9CARY|nr:hypothetical protein Cgig2_005465 [Carnegiea gigantea]
MALCRFLFLNAPLHRHSQFQFQVAANPNSSLSVNPSFVNLPLSHFHNRRCRFQCANSSSLASMESPPEGYRRNVGICLINPSKKIFAASRLDVPDSWQMPQGGIDEGEDPRSAAIRELREETGAKSVEVLAEVPYWLTYDFPPDVREKLKHQWGSDWKGQAQKWFLLKFLGDDNEINLLGDGTEKAEFGQWTWMSPEEVIERAVGFKRPVYEEVLKVFAPHLQ